MSGIFRIDRFFRKKTAAQLRPFNTAGGNCGIKKNRNNRKHKNPVSQKEHIYDYPQRNGRYCLHRGKQAF